MTLNETNGFTSIQNDFIKNQVNVEKEPMGHQHEKEVEYECGITSKRVPMDADCSKLSTTS